MSKRSKTNSDEKLIARWERKLERLGLGVLEPLCSSEQFTHLRPRKLNKCRWYEEKSDEELSAYRECLRRAITKLSYRERQIVILHDGIGDEIHCYTLEEIGHIFKITRERIRQVYAQAIRKLTDSVANDVVSNRILF